MFEIPHHHIHIKEWADRKGSVLSTLRVKSPERVSKNTDDCITTSYWDDFDYNEHIDFLNMLHPYLGPLHKELEVQRITRLWYQTSYKNGYHTPHDHGYEGWSAVFYANFNPEVHTATTFYRPFFSPNNKVHQIFRPKVVEGDLFIFPAFVMHESPINKSDVPRTIISFNLS